MPIERNDSVHLLNKREFHRQLRDWLWDTNENYIGNVLNIYDQGIRFSLQSNTTREAVIEYLHLVDEYGHNIEWTIVPTKRNRMRAVAHGPDRIRIIRFFLYK